MPDELVSLVEKWSKTMGLDTIPRDFLVEALERIEKGEVEVTKYPTGSPSLKGVYEIALRLYQGTDSKR